MIEKYFFIPASNKKYIENAKLIDADYFIYDLEDSILNRDLRLAVDNLKIVEFNKNSWIRVPFPYRTELVRDLELDGCMNFVIPKVRSVEDVHKFIDCFSLLENKSLCVLIENPLSLINLAAIINSSTLVKVVSLGSHDYSASLGMQHDFDLLFFARNVLLNNSVAYGRYAIDVASMEITDVAGLRKEFISAVRMGFSGKFFLHPIQLEIYNSTKFFSESEVQIATEIISKLNGLKDIEAIEHRGRIYEKVHLLNLQKIVKWSHTVENK